MGVFDSLAGRTDPSRDWIGEAGLRLRFDFDRHALNDVPVGASAKHLSFLGPAEDRRQASEGILMYPSHGLTVDLSGREIGGYTLHWEAEAVFDGSCVQGERALDFTVRTTEAEILAVWADPYWRDEDEDGEVILFYEHPRIERQVEIGPSGTLQAIVVTAAPLLADPERRRQYGVTKAWPPRLVAES